MSVNVEMRKGACDYVLENRTRAVIVKVRRALSHPPGKKKIIRQQRQEGDRALD